ncbi:putative oxidoreductase C-terminal domain-containing protein [Parabacteroides bouchesdurhonensis]|uniref:putative oxidoreductase C-terminal domain-containing protein n=1 Tax=Parabacteroides bouchesdurhonensis TaxID=1936995 RepID=UPI000E51B06E|nr:putative oxidoreductase C-terminal domain-containing protein [Parabacteroides bouchesdurhonensis]RHJ91820.1 oxidoreductase [Bacteroides sp. AM07-16]
MKYALYMMSFLLCACNPASKKTTDNTADQKDEVKLITLAPGHFHAALVQKEALAQVDSTVYVYAPDGSELDSHLKLIQSYNNRDVTPTHWNEVVYRGSDFLQRMLKEKKGNVVILAGNNRDKTDYILESVKAGFNVLADKPMAIDKPSFDKLVNAFQVAEQNGVLLYDIMTERYDIWSEIQRRLMQSPDVFGELIDGTEQEPAVSVSSVHHFYKVVSGSPLIRPVWYYDVEQQGEGIVDVTTHLVDLIHWKCFPDQIIDYKTDVSILNAKHWPTTLSKEQFALSTGYQTYPDFLQKYVSGSDLNVYANGSFLYNVKGKYIDISVIWNFEAPKGAGDIHKCIIKGTQGTLSILQGEEQGFVPKLYVTNNNKINRTTYRLLLDKVIESLQTEYPGLSLNDEGERWEIIVPDNFKAGHEAHFASVIRKYLGYLNQGDIPEWEIPNMLTKYYVTTTALSMAKDSE